jgi:hypothetical protein
MPLRGAGISVGDAPPEWLGYNPSRRSTAPLSPLGCRVVGSEDLPAVRTNTVTLPAISGNIFIPALDPLIVGERVPQPGLAGRAKLTV